jgi:hypothetical protein
MTADDFKTRVRLKVYDLFVTTGRCPKMAEVARALGCGLSDVTSAFQELAAAHVLVLQASGGEILMANPLSAMPTPFVVETQSDGGTGSWYGNCIWDALGVIAMLQGDGRVVTSCGCCGESMTVSVRNGAVEATPPGIVHFAIPAKHWWDDIIFN